MQRVTTPANLQLSPSEPDTTLESPQQCQKRRNPSTWVTSSQPPAQGSIPATGRRLPSGADRSPAAPGRRPPRPAGQPAPGSPGALVVPLPGQPGRRQDGLHGIIQQRRWSRRGDRGSHNRCSDCRTCNRGDGTDPVCQPLEPEGNNVAFEGQLPPSNRSGPPP